MNNADSTKQIGLTTRKPIRYQVSLPTYRFFAVRKILGIRRGVYEMYEREGCR